MNTSNSLISVIMPCYNAQEFIADAIKCVLNQTYRNLELIIVNDGSTDNSDDIIQSFSDGRIKYIFQKNKGQAAASNLGLRNAKGDYIKFFDADDLMNEKHLEAQLTRIEGMTNCIASCAWGRFYDNNSQSAKFKAESVWQDMSSAEWVKAALRQKYDMMGAWLWLIPKETIMKAGGWDERLTLNNDFEFSMRLLSVTERVLFANDARIFYRSGMKDALSQVYSRERFEAALLSTQLGCQYLLEKENTLETKLLCANRYQEWLFRVYPNHPDIQLAIRKKIDLLGGSNRKMDGGTVSQFLQRVIGWKATKRIQMGLRKIGYKKLPFN